MNHRSLAFRLGAWYTLLLSATFVVVGAGTFMACSNICGRTCGIP